ARSTQGPTRPPGTVGRGALDLPWEARTLSNAADPVNSIGHFSLTSKHFSRIMERESMLTSRLRTVVLSASLAIGLVSGTARVVRLAASASQMSVDEIRPGMVGIGRTVFDGTRVEEFKVH